MNTPESAARRLPTDAERRVPVSACKTDTETASARSSADLTANECLPHTAEETRARKNRGDLAAALPSRSHSRKPSAIGNGNLRWRPATRAPRREADRDRSVRPPIEMSRIGRSVLVQAGAQKAPSVGRHQWPPHLTFPALCQVPRGSFPEN